MILFELDVIVTPDMDLLVLRGLLIYLFLYIETSDIPFCR